MSLLKSREAILALAILILLVLPGVLTPADAFATPSGTSPDAMGRLRLVGWLRSSSTSTRSLMV